MEVLEDTEEQMQILEYNQGVEEEVRGCKEILLTLEEEDTREV